jgi:hypothetical protein
MVVIFNVFRLYSIVTVYLYKHYNEFWVFVYKAFYNRVVDSIVSEVTDFYLSCCLAWGY